MLAPRVVILGSGFAGLETAFLLRSKLGETDAEVTVVSDRDDFLFKPNTIYLPFGAAEKSLHVPLRKAFFTKTIHHRVGTVEGIDADRGVVHTRRGVPIHYDKLVIATGAAMNPEE